MATRRLPILRRNLVVCYVEFGKFSHNLHYVDYERLPIEEFSENGGRNSQNFGPKGGRQTSGFQPPPLARGAAGPPDVGGAPQHTAALHAMGAARRGGHGRSGGS